MKKIIFLFIFSAFLLGCDTTENDIPTVSIVGTWTGTAIDFTGTAQTEVQGIPVTANLVGEGDTLNFTYTLTENPNTATSEGSYNMEVTASVLLQSQTEYRENVPADFSGPWEQNGDTLTLTFEGEEVIANIVELTETTLVLQFAITQTEEINGFEATVTLDMMISFSR
ncbi:MAG: lipocalin family protein [Flavobacteriaceae bacterium]